MAGGEGTRLRPLTATVPKPLLPVVGRPLMEHVLRLLRQHGFTDVVVTLGHMGSLLRGYFGDGDELGINLTYATEQVPLGTAGSVRNAADALHDEPFLVISGDALTDVDLTELVKVHKARGSAVTIGLTRVADPLEFGVVVCGADDKVERIVEKPGWGQVLSDTVNTGIYVVEPSVLDQIPLGTASDWAADVLPALLDKGMVVRGHVLLGYWEDVGSPEAYRRVQADVLDGTVTTSIGGFQVSPGIWVGRGVEVDTGAVLTGPLWIGDYSRIEAGAELHDHTVLGSNVLVRSGAVLHRAVIHDNVFIGGRASLRGCVIGRGTDVMRAARVEEGAVIAPACLIGEEAIVSTGVKVYPAKTIEPGAVVTSNVVWESRSTRSMFGSRGVSGVVNVEITPEVLVRISAAWASTLPKGSRVVMARDHSRTTGVLARAMAAALNAATLDVLDLNIGPPSVARLQINRGSAGGVLLRTTPGAPDSVDITILDSTGAELSQPEQRRVERVYSRREFRRAFPGEMGDLDHPPYAIADYARQVVERVDVSGVDHMEMRVVVDAAGGAAGLAMPVLLSRIGVDVLSVNTRLDEDSPTETAAARAGGLHRLGELVASSRAVFGVRFDPLGERFSLVDDTGHPVTDDRALLVLLDLVAAERGAGAVALPVTTTRVAEQVCRFHGVDVRWCATPSDALVRMAAKEPLIFGGDGRGGFVVQEVSSGIDGLAAFVRLLGLVARTQLTLSQIDARIPRAHVLSRDVPTPWAAKAAVMRAVFEQAGSAVLDTAEGVRMVGVFGDWALVLPDPAGAAVRVWVEGQDRDSANAELDRWSRIVEQAAR